MLWDLSWDQNNFINDRHYSDYVFDLLPRGPFQPSASTTTAPTDTTTITQSSTTFASTTTQSTITTVQNSTASTFTQSPTMTSKFKESNCMGFGTDIIKQTH